MSANVVALEPRCKICKLPPDLRQLISKLRFEEDLSLFDICNRVNPKIILQGINALSPRNLMTHFQNHASEEEKVAYAIQNSQYTRSASASSDIFDNATAYFNSSRISGIIRELDVALQTTQSLIDRLSRDLAERQKSPNPLLRTEVETFFLGVDKLRLLAESLQKIATPQVVVEMFLDGVFRHYTDAVAEIFSGTAKELAAALREEVKSERERGAVVDLVREHGRSFHKRLTEKGNYFLERLKVLLASW